MQLDWAPWGFFYNNDASPPLNGRSRNGKRRALACLCKYAGLGFGKWIVLHILAAKRLVFFFFSLSENDNPEACQLNYFKWQRQKRRSASLHSHQMQIIGVHTDKHSIDKAATAAATAATTSSRAAGRAAKWNVRENQTILLIEPLSR